MTEETKMDPIDNLLAEFTDQLLDGREAAGKSERELLSLSSSDQNADLRALEETVVQVRQALLEVQPSPELSQRIRSRLANEWGKTRSQTPTTSIPVKKPANHWLQPFIDMWNQRMRPSRQRAFALSFVTLAAVVLLALVLLYPNMQAPQTGTVIGPAGWIPLIGLVFFLGVVALIWFFRSRH